MSAFINDSSMLFAGIWAICETVVIFTLAFKFFSKVLKRLDRIEYQLYNNGGESMKDAVDRIELDLAILKAKLGE